ncbi:hypothetical protein HU200_049883 [Digitaria exilis]|uniref:DUF6598 domain-containing protein n=1 Tax=Digitaria exilis TaxID=1010633 RepID=A0A835AVC4_9POAL|nr:hypothetical protein HU200_049883 [Digitaria exilis]
MEITYPKVVEEDPIDYEMTCPGQSFTNEQVEEVMQKWRDRRSRLMAEFTELYNNILRQGDGIVSYPPKPLKVLPETTYSCVERRYCYHCEYITSDTSTTISTLGFRRPQQMMQVFSLRLSSYNFKSYPISIYGIIAIHDDLEPLRNYVFDCSRDDPVMIHQDYSSALPLCSPCRGIYVLDHALLEVDLWVKKDGDGLNDEKLLSLYAEINVGLSFDMKFIGRIQSDRCMLDMDYTLLSEGVEAVIQVLTILDSPHHVRFSAFSRCFDNRIVLFEGKCVKKGEIFTHVVTVTAKEKLDIILELENVHLVWSFQDGAAEALSSPNDYSILDQFNVRVFFAPKNGECRQSRYHAWKERCRTKGGT